ncbi:MAG: hypothetical protein QOF24_1641 [Verrucomicrobiota bacterium]|jgi:hypothetical protein
MASHFLFRKFSLPVAAILLSGCKPSAQSTPPLAKELPSPAAARSLVTVAATTRETSLYDPRLLPRLRLRERRLRTRFQLDLRDPELIRAENKLRGALAQYPAANEETRINIEEHIAELAEAGVSKQDIVATLGAMFAMENSIPVKLSILNEFYYIQDPSVLEHVTAALSPNQPLDVRDEAISVVRDMGDQRAIPSLWPLLADPDDNIRDDAQGAIDAIIARTVSTAR